ncbi:MAG: hypothetical protein DRJ05_12000, partial [Bacteroidetes bacterium]
MGENNSADGPASFVGGINSSADGGYSFAFGNTAQSLSPHSVALGAMTTANGSSSFALGKFCKADGASAFVIGSGQSSSNIFTNSTHHSLMVGFNSDLPTLFVGGSIGLGLTGKIGIGDVTDPHAKLHIKADDGENVDLLLEPGGSSNFAKIKFGEISLNNSPNRIEAKQAGNMDFYTASDYVFRDGNVGIGEHNPDEKLVVDGNIKQSPEFHILSDKIKATGANGLMLQDGTGNGIVVNNGGKVGIGPDATNPSSELEVDGTIFTKHFRLDNSSGSSGPLTGFDGYLLQADEYGNASWADPTSINDGDWETNGDDIYNMNSGNIGIGIVAPESPLHIDSNIGNTNATFFKVSNEGTSIEGGGTTYIGKKAGN